MKTSKSEFGKTKSIELDWNDFKAESKRMLLIVDKMLARLDKFSVLNCPGQRTVLHANRFK
jgi:hypothetical protein